MGYSERRQDARICKHKLTEWRPIQEDETVAWFDILHGADPLKISSNSAMAAPLIPTTSASLGGVNEPNPDNSSDWPDYLPECDPRNHTFLDETVPYKKGNI